MSDEIERKIISMFGLGMSHLDIAGHLHDLLTTGMVASLLRMSNLAWPVAGHSSGACMVEQSRRYWVPSVNFCIYRGCVERVIQRFLENSMGHAFERCFPWTMSGSASKQKR
ncbi:MAG: hypothetical protein HRU33_12160 [Rhodobacteraceae bacterium]|nr:hypothetical protein [Paracoccaceae bacterium]